MKIIQRHFDNPVQIVRQKSGFIVKNEGGDFLNQPGSYKASLHWCLQNYCSPVKTFKTGARLQYLDSFLSLA